MTSRAVVVLGASNVARGWPSLVDTIVGLNISEKLAGPATDIFAAAGHGRSYGASSRVLARVLPSIVDCGLWSALQAYDGEVRGALVTDIGNDLLYEYAVDDVLRWVATCVERLASHTDRIAVTLLPNVSTENIGRLRFLFFRTLFVPACRLGREELARRVAALNDGLRRLAATMQFELVEQDSDWYGMDPIHVLSRSRHRAWERMFSTALGRSGLRNGASGEASGRRCPSRQRGRPRAARRWMFGVEQCTVQPSARLASGGAISWF
ncbi:MAG: hypothetical protein R3C10_00815 [Pirellulales bacterium]